MKQLLVICAFALTSLLPSCYIDQAKEVHTKVLVIASNYLKESDTTIFESFCKEEKVRIRILSIDFLELRDSVDKTEYNSGIDIIMLKSVNQLRQLNDKHLIQTMNFKLSGYKEAYIHNQYNCISYGFDPYVIFTPHDSLPLENHYKTLVQNEHGSLLSSDEETVLFSQLRSGLSRTQLSSWLVKHHEKRNSLEISEFNVDTIPYFLSLSSDYFRIKSEYNDVEFKMEELTNSAGEVFANLRTVAIIDQSPNYTLCKSFVEHCTNAGYNSIINEKLASYGPKWGESNSSNKLIVRPKKIEQSLQFNLTTSRVLNRLN